MSTLNRYFTDTVLSTGLSLGNTVGAALSLEETSLLSGSGDTIDFSVDLGNSNNILGSMQTISGMSAGRIPDHRSRE